MKNLIYARVTLFPYNGPPSSLSKFLYQYMYLFTLSTFYLYIP